MWTKVVYYRITLRCKKREELGPTVGKVTVKQETRQKKQRQGSRTIVTGQIITCTSIGVGCKTCPAGGEHTNHQYVDCCRDEQGKLFSVSLRCTSPMPTVPNHGN